MLISFCLIIVSLITGMVGETDQDRKSPGEIVYELIKLTLSSSMNSISMSTKKIKKMIKSGTIFTKLWKWVKSNLNVRPFWESNDKDSSGAREYSLQM